MTQAFADIVGELRNIQTAPSPYKSLGQLCREAAAEIERMRLLMAERDQFIVERGLWAEFLKEFGSHKCYANEQSPNIVDYCSDCGAEIAEGDVHGCPGRPGENKW